jgi:serine/threonine-protein kinase HipA
MTLTVHMYGLVVGTLTARRGVLQFEYSPDAIGRGIGTPLLSVSLPVRRAAYRGEPVAAYFDGLLPEGDALRMLAYDFKVSDDDTIGLLAELGRDCAGALQIVPDGRSTDQGGGSLRPLTGDDVGVRLRALNHAPLGVDDRVRISLAGVQEKLALASTPDGWALPLDGAPSTHILKPAHPHLPASVPNEALCLAIARHVGVDAAHAVVQRYADRDVLVVERFDRTHDGPVVRIHQEDMCQAHGIGPRHKYEEHGGPSLRSCARLLRDWSSDQRDLEKLLALTTVNVVLGNADAHGKNLSLLHRENGSIELAPAYDIMCTRYYGADTTAAMFVDGRRDIDHINIEHLVNEAVSWGVSAGRAEHVVYDVVRGMVDALNAACSQVDAPQALVDLIDARIQRAHAQRR